MKFCKIWFQFFLNVNEIFEVLLQRISGVGRVKEWVKIVNYGVRWFGVEEVFFSCVIWCQLEIRYKFY